MKKIVDRLVLLFPKKVFYAVQDSIRSYIQYQRVQLEDGNLLEKVEVITQESILEWLYYSLGLQLS